eukprot:CAMPEP_0201876208 /NCGR_PEP_ID=MMETSP0902-20130614/7960_1 /ASSEMBLY_ACC=CAM_ASM_000551 /TAXON_ID=420261 /ORGANISM="Thalassiosira antarctica, Strain CCMP982" /LENGTH=320 /DNA_ID=CAMNT_0048403405 /DNA_START=31 /DNA_END=993 /DNA_ORIENTATION=+
MILLTSCNAFTSSSKRNARCPPLLYTNSNTDAIADNRPLQIKPNWVPWELVELAAADMQMTEEEFVETFADIEAYTSCDDEGDDFHECDFFKNYLGPTKWLHLTPEAQTSIDKIHFSIWKDVWSRPYESVDVADKVSKECLRHYNEFMLEPRTSSIACPTDRPLIRVKVVPASFGLEGFEDAIWEATEDLMKRSTTNENTESSDTQYSSTDEYCKAITFVVAAPDLFTDPILTEGGGERSPQVEFEPDRFQEFASSLRGKIVMFSKMEGVPLDDAIKLTPFHPLWKLSDGASNGGVELDGREACTSFPYPCVAVSTKIEV